MRLLLICLAWLLVFPLRTDAQSTQRTTTTDSASGLASLLRTQVLPLSVTAETGSSTVAGVVWDAWEGATAGETVAAPPFVVLMTSGPAFAVGQQFSIAKRESRLTVRHMDRYPETDLRRITYNGSITGLAKVEQADRDQISKGSKVVFFGFRSNGREIFARGSITMVAMRGDFRFIGTDIDVPRDASGGLFDDRGRILALSVASTLPGATGIAGISAEHAAELERATLASFLLANLASFPKEQTDALNSPALIAWLLTARTQDGRRMFEAVGVIADEFVGSKEVTQSVINETLRKASPFIRMYLKQAGVPLPEDQAPRKIHLSCEMGTVSGGPKRNYSFEIDLTRGTLNGRSAVITDSEISSSLGESELRINRYTGDAAMIYRQDSAEYARRGQVFATGKCKQAEQRQF